MSTVLTEEQKNELQELIENIKATEYKRGFKEGKKSYITEKEHERGLR